MLDLDLCTADEFTLSRNSLRRELSAAEGLCDLRIAVLGGSTVEPMLQTLEVLLLASGFRPRFHRGEYGRFYEEAVHETAALAAFQPDLIYLHTSSRNVLHRPSVQTAESDLPRLVAAELDRWREIWDSLERSVGCQIIQNNFEPLPVALLGNMEAVAPAGQARFLTLLNAALAAELAKRPRVLLQDVASLAALVGLRRWFDPERWFAYKVLHTPEADLELGRSLTAMVRALYGRSRKVLVLDLDNTCWGGVIGDDGVDGIVIGRETPQAEAFTAFQQHCLALRARGVLLAVCSKNDDAVARSGFAHPDSVLRLEHFSCFQANWQPKPLNLLAMADELALGLESFVFVDDNPAEREMVRAQLPAVAVPEVGCEPARFVEILQAGRYFEPATLSAEDLGRAALYEQRAAAQTQQARFGSYGEYLDSLGMVGEIDTFRPVYMERIAQLTNKSNQFNLTTRRFTRAQLEEAAADPASIALYGRLADKFGDNGLVAVVMGTQQGREFRIELWLMSCRVLKRDMEHAMLDALVERARSRGVETLIGVYLPSAKNGMVRDFYAGLGFAAGENDASLPAGSTTWRLELAGYQARNTHIRVLEFAHV